MSLNIKIIDHPLVQHKISLLRDASTGAKEFRELVSEISTLMTFEVTRDLPVKEVDVETPLAVAKSKVISGRKLACVPILRAGLAMCDGVTMLVPAAKIGHIGIFRDPNTYNAVEYYTKLPEDIAEREVILVDPILATGVSAVGAVEKLREAGAGSIKFMCVIAAPQGVQALNDAFPDVEIYAGALDKGLDEHNYVVPGVGDCGDRLFGTK